MFCRSDTVLEVCDSQSGVGRQSIRTSLFGSRPMNEEEEEDEEDEEEEEDEDFGESAAYQFLPIIIKINNEIELTSQVPPFYSQGGGHCRPSMGIKRTAVETTVAAVTAADSDLPSESVSESTNTANSDNSTATIASQTADTTLVSFGGGGGSSHTQRCRTAVERFESSQPVACRHLEGSPSRRAGRDCNGHQCRPPNGHNSNVRNGYSSPVGPQRQLANGRQEKAGRSMTSTASGPTGRPVLVRQHHLDTDIHPDLTRKRHSCVPASWHRGTGRHRRTESI